MGFEYALIREVAEETARRHGVSPGEVAACAVLLPVEGRWWRHCAPGAVACSLHAATDPALARDALAAAFESGPPD